MKAAFIQETGPANKIIYGDLPAPTPAGSQVRIKVGAVAVNPIDTYIRSGMVAAALPKPYIIGCDVAGVVEAVGAEVKNLKTGDRVWGTNQGLQGRQGTFAEQIVVNEGWLYPTPAGVSDETAAAVSLVGITAHLGLFRDAKLKAGETIFIRGGTGGVGAMVVQMAKAIGARVITTAGSADKAALAKELSADHVIEYRTQKLDDELKKIAPAGVQVWWETLNEPDFDLAVSQLASRGRLIVMAGRQARPIFPVGPFYVKGCSMHGFAMFNATPDEQRKCSVDINRWLNEGKLKARIDRVLPLAQAAEAHRLQEESTSQKSGALSGKIVLKP